MAQADVVLERLEDQLNWYDTKSAGNGRIFKGLKIGTMVISLSIPLFAALSSRSVLLGSVVALVTGALGATIAVLEGIQQIGKYQQNWITYRTTAEALKREKYLFLSEAAHYRGAEDLRALLAERVEAIISQEHLQWQEHAAWGSKQEPKKSGT